MTCSVRSMSTSSRSSPAPRASAAESSSPRRASFALLVEVLEPTHGRVYDPACGSGGMFVQAEKFLEAHHKDLTAISIYGQELNERTWRLARMNLAIHGLNGQLGNVWGDTFAIDLHADTEMDYVMSNPPFNIKDVGAQGGRPALALRRAAGRRTRTTRGSSTSSASSRPAAGRCRHGQRVDVVELRRRGRHPGAARRGRPRVVHGRPADAALPQHRHSGVRLVLREGQVQGQGRIGRPQR